MVNAEEQLPTGLRARVEAVLTRLQPNGVVSRTNGLFVAHSAAHARKFLLAEPNPEDAPIFVYEVDVPKLVGLPMVLVDRIAQSVNDPVVDEIAAEYWNPIESWRFLESVVDKMVVVAVCTNPDLIALSCAQIDYDSDRTRAIQLWPLKPSP